MRTANILHRVNSPQDRINSVQTHFFCRFAHSPSRHASTRSSKSQLNELTRTTRSNQRPRPNESHNSNNYNYLWEINVGRPSA